MRVQPVSTLAIVAVVGGLAALVAFGVPDPVMGLIAQATGMTALVPPAKGPMVRIGTSRWAQDVNLLPEETRAPLEATSVVGRLRDIRARPPLTVETTTLVVPPGTPTLRIVAPRLVLRDVTLVTNGATVEIETEQLDVANTVIRAFAPAAGLSVGSGGDGGRVRLVLRGPLRGVLRVDLSGQAGAAGTVGAPGAAGMPGSVGTRARSARTECLAPAGRGGQGGAGGPGGAGRAGGIGGNGGDLVVVGLTAAEVAENLRFTAEGGPGGVGGAGGTGGAGGAGGLGGDPAGVCFGSGPNGTDGPPGAAGVPGEAGTAGTSGRLRVEPDA